MTQGSPPIQDIEAFAAVAQYASFTRAARQMGTSKSNVGKAVQRLEAHLGTKLFQRTTRAVRLTEDGEIYLDAARSALDGLKEAELQLAARREQPEGRVRLDIPAGFGGFLLPTLPAFRLRHPKVLLEIALNDRAADPVGEGWDIVVRIGALPADGDMPVRKLCDLINRLYASPGYLRSRPPITTVGDLMSQEAVLFRSASGKLRQWSVFEDGHIKEIAPAVSIVVDDGRALIDAARAGLGMVQLFDRVGDPLVASGKLVHILPQADVPAPAVHALVPLGRGMLPKTRAVLEHLAAILRDG